MLACRSVLAELDDVPTLVFDEVDAGVGGRAAAAVGRRLAALAATRQVVVVTHLAQIAAHADRHFLVTKEAGAATVRRLDDDRPARRARPHALGRRHGRVAGARPRPDRTGQAGLSGRDGGSARALTRTRGRPVKVGAESERFGRGEGVALRVTRRRERVGIRTARVDRRTKNLLRRVQPGEVAIIDHEDLDRVAAEELVAKGVSAVVNASPSISGRYPNLGPADRRRGGRSC